MQNKLLKSYGFEKHNIVKPNMFCKYQKGAELKHAASVISYDMKRSRTNAGKQTTVQPSVLPLHHPHGRCLPRRRQGHTSYSFFMTIFLPKFK